MSESDPFLYSDAAYVLGALTSDERTAFEQHLRTCTECTARVRELQPIPTLLAGLPESAFLDEDEPPETLLPGLLREVRREARRRRWMTGGLAGVAAACLAALVITVWPSGDSTPPPREMSALVASPMHATATLEATHSGTEISLACHYDAGTALPAGYWYSLVVIDKRGAAHHLGSWTLAPGKETDFTSSTPLGRNQIATVQIQFDGKPILQLAT